MMELKYLWKFSWYVRRGGNVTGLFVATEQEVQNLTGKYVYFGEILGKHSEVYGHIEEGEIVKLDVSTEAVAEITEILGNTWSGYNPMDYVHVNCVRCEDSERAEEMWVVNDEYVCGSCVTEEEIRGN